MAGDATDVILAVYRVNGVHVLSAAGVAGQTTGVDFFRRSVLEQEYLCFVAATCHVISAWTVATFAALVRRAAFRIEGRIPVRRFLPGVVDFLVAGLASFCAKVFGGRSQASRGFAGGLRVLGGNWWVGLP